MKVFEVRSKPTEFKAVIKICLHTAQKQLHVCMSAPQGAQAPGINESFLSSIQLQLIGMKTTCVSPGQ